MYDVEPEVLPNLYHGQPVRLYGRYKTAGPATIQVKAEILGSPLEQSLPVTLPATDATNPEIERMWASHRVERLMAAGRAEGSNGHADEIVRLCEGYSIASQYASFIVLENDTEYRRWKIARRNATRVQRDRQAQLAVREGLAQLRHDTAQQLGPKSDAKPAGPEGSLGAAGKQSLHAVSKKLGENERNPSGSDRAAIDLRSQPIDLAGESETNLNMSYRLVSDEQVPSQQTSNLRLAASRPTDRPSIEGPASDATTEPAAASAGCRCHGRRRQRRECNGRRRCGRRCHQSVDRTGRGLAGRVGLGKPAKARPAQAGKRLIGWCSSR